MVYLNTLLAFFATGTHVWALFKVPDIIDTTLRITLKSSMRK